ncbi:Cupredoxin [Xylariales sp. PMI_506]|nr:Cupredoxin [Xylariales sp. PMI_506]
MRFSLYLAQLAAVANAATVTIYVAESGLTFTPSSVTANVGDELEFRFYTGGHGVASSTLDTPCAPGTAGFYSGFITGDSSADTAFVTTVNSTDPIFFYCPKGSHCKSGMVGVVNPANSTDLATYSAAAKVASVVTPAAVAGGTVTTLAAAAARTP